MFGCPSTFGRHFLHLPRGEDEDIKHCVRSSFSLATRDLFRGRLEACLQDLISQQTLYKLRGPLSHLKKTNDEYSGNG